MQEQFFRKFWFFDGNTDSTSWFGKSVGFEPDFRTCQRGFEFYFEPR
ncbi:hypothetical protein LEP1GSC103_3750 [Leptospira borgpetersenii serovar Javanica str. UI 09931]|uniref:Uncharacterized protein n=1 Tax=Leptospira borgpetersenii serovar Javanica str. UI 09931 TaxID=1049767 RepID=A0AAV3JK81_LEPBO|nr:hypothetical protein LEP1GSC103_3750 [Leptospira borgpetersenii serovar Javanica str. UI 09931]